MKSQVLVGAEKFMEALSHRASSATDSLYVQAMTFEGDAAGQQLIDLMISSPAQDKRLIVDSFSKVVVSDHFVYGPKYLRHTQFRHEVRNTRALLNKAKSNGIKVKFVNPTGPLMLRYPLRNHKKMMVVDGQFSFLGGINFSDHNFEWHDMMIALDDLAIGNTLCQDFLATWQGKNQSLKVAMGEHQLYFFNGVKSQALYSEFFDVVRSAKKCVTVISPYVSEPLLPVLAEVASRGVEVVIISPQENNKGLFHDYLVAQSSRGFFRLMHHPGMFHLKAMMIDDRMLVFGSSNYDLVSYHFEQEVVMVSEDKELLLDFDQQVLRPMTQAAHEFNGQEARAGKAKVVMGLLKSFCQVASRTLLRPV